MIDKFELEMKLLEGKPVDIGNNTYVNKVSFSTISDVGYFKYNNIIGLLCVNNEKLKSYLKIDDVDLYTYIISLSVHAVEIQNDEQVEFLRNLIEVLRLIFRETVLFDPAERNFCVGENGILNRDNFFDFVNVIKVRNCLEDIENISDNPDSERTRQLLERRKQLREKVNKTKNQSGEDGGLTLLDLISIYAEAEHMKPEDVFQYDMYQFNNQFNRMKIFKDYEVNIQALLAGAKSEDINLKHWLSKIDKKQE